MAFLAAMGDPTTADLDALFEVRPENVQPAQEAADRGA